MLPQHNKSSLGRILFSASVHLTDLREIKKAELLSALLFGRLCTLILISLYMLYYRFDYAAFIIATLFAINALEYVLSRTRHYKSGAALMIIDTLVTVPIIAAIVTTKMEVGIAPVWLSLAVLMSSLILSARWTLITLIGSVMSSAVVVYILGEQFYGLTLGATLFNFVSCTLTLISANRKEEAIMALDQERANVIEVSRLSAIGEMAGGMAHEINTPLNAIIMSAELVEERLEEDQALLKASLRSIVMAGERIAKIIRGLRTFSKEVSGTPELVSVSNVIHMTLDLCRTRFETNKVDIRLRLEPHERHVFAQNSELAQVLLHLLNNSFDAISHIESRWVEIDTEVKGPFVSIGITDSGAGIPAKDAPKIFLPFFTTKEIGSGIGLGLSISKGVLQKYGGDLIYDNTSAKTRFVLRLPLANFIKTV